MAILVIISGESNSGGLGDNSRLTNAEKGQRQSVQILNNNSLTFEPLEIGVNNLIGHGGLNDNATHGWELGLANNVNKLSPPVYLCKTGQGGSIIGQWLKGSPNYNAFLTRINAVKQIGINSGITYKPILWYTQGINDAIANNNVYIWKSDTIEHFDKIRLEFPNIPILFCDVTPQYPAYTAAIKEIANIYPNCYFIPVNGAAFADPNHWNYDGLKLISGRMVDKTASIFFNTSSKTRSKFLPKLFARFKRI